MKIKDKKIETFLEEVASSAPTPGGGAVAGVTGATAASLVEMVINLTKDNPSLSASLGEIKKLRNKLLEHADEDVRAFNSVMAAYKISKEDVERGKEIQKALKYATEVPLSTAQSAYEVNKSAKEALEVGNKNASSDAKTAMYLSEAAIKSALENVNINLGYIEDEDFVNKIEAAVAKLKQG